MQSQTFAATYIRGAEAAVRSRRADNPVDVRRIETLHVHVYQMLLEGWNYTNLSDPSLHTDIQTACVTIYQNDAYALKHAFTVSLHIIWNVW